MIFEDTTPSAELGTTGQNNQADSAESNTLAQRRTPDEIDKLDKLNELSSKLAALVVVTYGESGAVFRRIADNFQDCYMWQCADLACELKTLVHSIDRATFTAAEGVGA